MAVRAIRLDERHRSRHATEQLVVGLGCRDRCDRRDEWRCWLRLLLEHGLRLSLDGDGQRRWRRLRPVARQRVGKPLGEDLPPLLRHGLGVLEVVVEQRGLVARVQACGLRVAHGVTRVPVYQRELWVVTAIAMPAMKQTPATASAIPASRSWCRLMPAAVSPRRKAATETTSGWYASASSATKRAAAASRPAIRSTDVRSASA